MGQKTKTGALERPISRLLLEALVHLSVPSARRGTSALTVAAVMVLLPETAAATEGASPIVQPVLPVLLGCLHFLGTCIVTCCRQGTKPRPGVENKATQTDVMPTAVLMPVPSHEPRPIRRPMVEDRTCVAVKCGEKFHSSRACGGLSGAHGVKMFERCRTCG